MLEHGAGSDFAERLALEAKALGHGVESGGQHVLIGGPGVGAVLAGEGDAVPAQDRHPTDVFDHFGSLLIN